MHPLLAADQFFQRYELTKSLDLLFELIWWSFTGSQEKLSPEERGRLIVFYGDLSVFLRTTNHLYQDYLNQQESESAKKGGENV